MNRAIFLSLLFAVASLAQAQTGPVHTPPEAASDQIAQTPAATNAPADVAPLVAAPPQSSQVIMPSIPGQANAATKTDDIYDIRPPFYYLHSWLLLWLGLAAIAVIALLIALWRLFRPNRQLSPKTAYELTLEKLEKARGLLREDNPMPYAVFVSETIRTYLGQRFQSPSTRRTTDEFLRLMEADRNTPLADHRDLLRDFLQSCDLVKFARYQPTFSELEQVQQRAYSFVTATKPLVVPNHTQGRRP